MEPRVGFWNDCSQLTRAIGEHSDFQKNIERAMSDRLQASTTATSGWVSPVCRPPLWYTV